MIRLIAKQMAYFGLDEKNKSLGKGSIFSLNEYNKEAEVKTKEKNRK